MDAVVRLVKTTERLVHRFRSTLIRGLRGDVLG